MYGRLCLSLVLMWSLSSAAAGQASLSSIWERKALVDKCNEMTKELNGWWGAKQNIDDRTLPKDKVDLALEMLGSIQYPNRDDLALIQGALDKDFSSNYLKWLEMAGADCIQGRVAFSKALINSAKSYPDRKDAIKEKIKASLQAEKYLTFLDTNIDGVVMDYALSKGLFTLPDTARKELGDIRASSRNEFRDWQAKYQDVFDKLGGKEEKFKALAGKDVEQVKKAVNEESFATQKSSRRLRDIATQLK